MNRFVCAFLLLLIAGPSYIIAAATPVSAAELGSTASARVEVLTRQIPLPAGEWTVVGRGTNALTSGTPGAYGTIENVILARRSEGRIDGLVEINANRLPVGGGWGVAADCARSDGLATVAFYKTPVDGFCMFVTPTAIGDPAAPGPAAWERVRPMLQEGGAPSPLWLTVGFRVSDRRDVLDVRYHLDPRRLGFRPLPASDWTLEKVLAAPERYSAVNQLSAWGSLAAGLVEDGFRGALNPGATALPNAWDVAAPKEPISAAAAAQPLGRVAPSQRLAALDALVESGTITAADHAAYLKAIEEAPPPPNPDDYYRLLGMKVFSFNFFRVSVDYILAFVVTVNNLISGYITATIVATHSVAQVFNDMWWDNYIATQAKSATNHTDFVYIGVRTGGVS